MTIEEQLNLVLGELRDLNANIVALGLTLRNPKDRNAPAAPEVDQRRREAIEAFHRDHPPGMRPRPPSASAAVERAKPEWGLDFDPELTLRDPYGHGE